MKVLITNFRLAARTGTELYVHDLALRLLERGHTPVVYSPVLGERRARPEEVQVDEARQHADAPFGDGVFEDELVAAGVVDGDVAQDAREARRRVGRAVPVVTEVDGRGVGEVEQGEHRLVPLLPVYDVGRRLEAVEVVHDRHGLPANQLGERAGARAVEDGRMAEREQPAREVERVQLRPRALAQREVGDENFETVHRGFAPPARRLFLLQAVGNEKEKFTTETQRQLIR